MARTLPPLHPLHPGEILREEFLQPLRLSAGALARHLGVPRTRIERIAAERGAVSPDTALRLGRALNTSAQFWLTLQDHHNLALARRAAGRAIDRIKPIQRNP